MQTSQQLQTVIHEVCFIDNENEVTTMLDFYHDLGIIVKHGSTVVLQAQWLIDLFRQLITIRRYNDMVRNINVNCMYQFDLYWAGEVFPSAFWCDLYQIDLFLSDLYLCDRNQFGVRFTNPFLFKIYLKYCL